MKRLLPVLPALIAALLPSAARAEEGAAGHYVPGAAASFIDTLPGKPSFVAANLFTYYHGDAGASRTFRFSGLTVADVDATIYADMIVGLWQTPLQLFGGHYAAGIGIPFVSMEVKGRVQPPIGPTFNRRDTATGLGDILLMPFMLGWTNGPDFKYDVRLSVYAPTGEFEEGELANAGRNHWTFEPSVSVSWLSSKIGTEVSVFAGLDFNTKNEETDYQSGASFHVEGTIAQHLPLGKLGFIGVGVNGFLYQQITGDSGSGARLGDFEGRTAGVGPVVSFVTKIGDAELAAEVKWLPELNVERRLKGDIIWFKLGVVF
jgi:hypothetical protein